MIEFLTPHIVAGAEKIAQKYPNERIFSLGQTPAWILKTIELQDEAKKREVGYIPFSKSLNCSLSKIGKDYCYMFDIDDNTRNLIAQYRKTLEKLGLSPEKIIESGKNGINTVILEGIVERGGGIASFLYILTDWAKELNKETEMLEYLKIVGMDASKGIGSNLYDDDSKFLYDNLIIKDKATSTKIKIDSEKFCNTEALCRLSMFDDSNRLVAHYPPDAWGKEPVLLPDSQSLNAFMEQEISEAIKKERITTNVALNLNSNQTPSSKKTEARVVIPNIETPKLKVSIESPPSQDSNLENTPKILNKKKGLSATKKTEEQIKLIGKKPSFCCIL